MSPASQPSMPSQAPRESGSLETPTTDDGSSNSQSNLDANDTKDPIGAELEFLDDDGLDVVTGLDKSSNTSSSMLAELLTSPSAPAGRLRLAMQWDNRWDHSFEILRDSDAAKVSVTVTELELANPRNGVSNLRSLLPTAPPVPLGTVGARPAVSFAHGRLVVYRDRNGNGRLDGVTRANSAPIDEIFAYAVDDIYFFPGPITREASSPARDAQGRWPHAGYNLRQGNPRCDLFRLDVGGYIPRDVNPWGEEPCARTFTWQDGAWRLRLKRAVNPASQVLMCREGYLRGFGGSSSGLMNVTATSPQPTFHGGSRTCSNNGRTMTDHCPTSIKSATACDDWSFSTCQTEYRLDVGSKPPAWWPCPLQ
jgi:hypothetical protein